ncbi:hypothetical protein BOH78_1655 [Pichia kudriavzevii]|uniref:Uncharacterized protein n=1 Tax=Pichia kudriavzevii TaxID=4909 RepID=A0A1V2LQT7_PICKU|nr:hypothetical protein BOH78_1655 [Pichia kudriavzevii]
MRSNFLPFRVWGTLVSSFADVRWPTNMLRRDPTTIRLTTDDLKDVTPARKGTVEDGLDMDQGQVIHELDIETSFGSYDGNKNDTNAATLDNKDKFLLSSLNDTKR